MLGNCHKLAAFAAAFLVLSCVQPRESAEAEAPISATWPCFNGCTIFLQGEKYGLMTDSGKPILPAEYNSIEFLDADIALLEYDGEYALSDKTGRIIGRGLSADIRESWSSVVERTMEQDRQLWEQVVRNYEQLCASCKAARGDRLSRKDFSALTALRDSVLKSLDKATGRPTASQRARLEALSQDYRRAF